jgi:hypothetical protein
MRYMLRAPIEGTVVLQYPARRVSTERNGVELALEVGEKGVVAHAVAAISVPSAKVQAFKSTTGAGHSGSDFSLKIGGDKELYEFLLTALQDLELDLGFAFPGIALRRIRWTDAEHRFVAETAEEESLLSVTSYSTSKSYPESVAKITEKGFRDLLEYTSHTRALSPAKAFWLRGQNDFLEFRYVQAFYSFYFVLEWLYANGKFKKSAVLAQFEKSTILNSALEASIQAFRAQGRHWQAMLGDMAYVKDGGAVDLAAIRRYLVELRGRAHHVSAKDSSRIPVRDGEQRYETAALVAMHVATVVIELEERALNLEHMRLRHLCLDDGSQWIPRSPEVASLGYRRKLTRV